MPRRVQKSSSKTQQQHQRKNKAAPSTVPKFKYFAKAALAAYPDKDGNPIYLGDAADMQEFTSNGAVSRTRNKTNCEFLHRPGMAVNLNASTFATGLRLAKRLPRKSVISPDAKKVLKGWSAYDQVLDLFDTDSGRAFAVLPRSPGVRVYRAEDPGTDVAARHALPGSAGLPRSRLRRPVARPVRRGLPHRRARLPAPLRAGQVSGHRRAVVSGLRAPFGAQRLIFVSPTNQRTEKDCAYAFSAS